MSLETTIAHIRQRYGPRALTQGRPVQAFDRQATRAICTGFAELDDALGTGGLPKGRIVELLGHPTSGKTSLALTFLAHAQGQGQWVSYVDPANVFDPGYAHRCGLDLSRLAIGFPNDLEQTLAMVETLATADGVSAVVLDAGGLGCRGLDVGHAGSVSATLHRLVAPLSRSGAVLLVLCDALYGSRSLSALPHLASLRLQIVRERWIWRYRDVQGYEARIDILKNRLGPSGRSVVLSFKLDGSRGATNL
jgi:recombination protein RecA